MSAATCGIDNINHTTGAFLIGGVGNSNTNNNVLTKEGNLSYSCASLSREPRKGDHKKIISVNQYPVVSGDQQFSQAHLLPARISSPDHRHLSYISDTKCDIGTGQISASNASKCVPILGEENPGNFVVSGYHNNIISTRNVQSIVPPSVSLCASGSILRNTLANSSPINNCSLRSSTTGQLRSSVTFDVSSANPSSSANNNSGQEEGSSSSVL